MIKKSEKAASMGRGFLKALPYIGLSLGGFIMIYPFVFSLLGSFCSVAEYRDALFLPFSKSPFSNLENYTVLFRTGTNFARPLFLTLAKIIFMFVVSVLVNAFGGYVFAKVEFKFKRTIFTILLSSMMIPGVAMLVPNFLFMVRFPLVGGNGITGQGGSGFINNPAVLFINGWVSVYGIFLFRQSFVSLGKEIAESGEVDGACFARIVLQLYLPLIKPIIAVTFLNTFLGNWNDYMTSLIMLPDLPDWRMISTTAATLMDLFSNPLRVGGADYPKAFAISTIMMIPPLIVFLCMQKQFVEGLAMGAIKG